MVEVIVISLFFIYTYDIPFGALISLFLSVCPVAYQCLILYGIWYLFLSLFSAHLWLYSKKISNIRVFEPSYFTYWVEWYFFSFCGPSFALAICYPLYMTFNSGTNFTPILFPRFRLQLRASSDSKFKPDGEASSRNRTQDLQENRFRTLGCVWRNVCSTETDDKSGETRIMSKQH